MPDESSRASDLRACDYNLGARFSVTVSPTNDCSSRMWRAMYKVQQLVDDHLTFHPHVTLQMIEPPLDLLRLESDLAQICGRVSPFDLSIGGLGLIRDRAIPTRVYLTYSVGRSPALLHMFDEIRMAVQDAGGKACLPVAETWLPHVTLGYDDFSPDELPFLEQELRDVGMPCVFQVDEIRLNEQPEGTEWRTFGRFRLAGSARLE